MTTILHLSDLHLVDPANSPRHAHEKIGLLHKTGGTYFKTLRSTLEALTARLIEEERGIDAIVMSGDVADKNDAGGFAAFPELLTALNPLLPEPGSIVVVPGNHDVRSGLLPGNGERYNRFVEFIRGAKYVTPLLDGIDPSPDPHSPPAGHLLRVGDVEIVPINSAGYSQIRIDTRIPPEYWKAMEKALKRARANGQVLSALDHLQRADAARIDESHLEDVARLLAGSAVAGRRDPANSPVRIAVMHHQLLPVSVQEEVKPFESLTNLGQVREFLRDQGISILLHGHKHENYTYVDHIGEFDNVHSPPHPIRVIAGPGPTKGTFSRRHVARLLTVDRAAGMLRVEAIPAVAAGKRPRPLAASTFPIDVPGGAVTARTKGVTVVDAESVKALHARVRYLTDGTTPIVNLVARLGRSPRGSEIAALYDGFAPVDLDASESDQAIHAEAMVERFTQLVEWWQNPIPFGTAAERSFTHGNRILRYAGHIDQLEDVAVALENDSATTRSVMVLLQPGADRIADQGHEFPSFCMAQFSVRSKADGHRYLDCVVYFRKLELRYWWLVNLAELASLQQRLVERLTDGAPGKSSKFVELQPGSITTIAARAELGSHPLRVQVPMVDRYYAISRQRLTTLAYAVVFQEIARRDDHGAEWVRLLEELVPPRKRPGGELSVAVEGLEHLRQEVAALVPSHKGDASLQMLATALADLAAANRTFAELQRLNGVTGSAYNKWVKEVERLVTLATKHSAGRILGLTSS